jgi:hypothetical protein
VYHQQLSAVLRFEDMTLTWINMYFKLSVYTERQLTVSWTPRSGTVKKGEVGETP